MNKRLALTLIVCLLVGSVAADSTHARSDGVTHELSPVDDVPGNFTDQREHIVYRRAA